MFVKLKASQTFFRSTTAKYDTKNKYNFLKSFYFYSSIKTTNAYWYRSFFVNCDMTPTLKHRDDEVFHQEL